MLLRAVLAAAFVSIAAPALAEPENSNWPNYQEGDFIIKDYKFASGQTLSQLKLHYRTLGSAERNAAGEIVNGVLLLQGNTGTGVNWLRPSLADELFKDGQPLDAGRYFIIMPDALGRGGSSKPSDWLKGNFPHYRYHDMVDSVHPRAAMVSPTVTSKMFQTRCSSAISKRSWMPAGLERFALLGISQGCAVSIAYAVRHPERVTHLVLFGGYPIGWAKRARSAAEKEQGQAMLTLVRLGWGQENPAFRQLFTSQFIPGGTKEQADWFNELQRISTSPEDAARNLIANGDTDVSALLGQVSVPTLVMHARDDARVPFDQGRQLAAGIRGARFVSLASRNHLILEDEPAFPRFVDEIRSFLAA